MAYAPLYQPWLCTLDYVRLRQDLMDVDAEMKDDLLLRRFIASASAEFIERVGRTPMPFLQTRQQMSSNARILSFDEDLLDATTLMFGETEQTLSRYTFWPLNRRPSRYAQASLASGCVPFPVTCTGSTGAIQLAAVWGYVPHYPNCWPLLGIDLIANVTAIQTELTLTSDQNALIEIGMYLKLEDEVLWVANRREDNAGVILTLTRGELGTVAVLHTATVLLPLALRRFQQREDIAAAVAGMVLYKYKTKDRIGSQVIVYDGGGVTVEDMDRSIYDTIALHRRKDGFQV